MSKMIFRIIRKFYALFPRTHFSKTTHKFQDGGYPYFEPFSYDCFDAQPFSLSGLYIYSCLILFL